MGGNREITNSYNQKKDIHLPSPLGVSLTTTPPRPCLACSLHLATSIVSLLGTSLWCSGAGSWGSHRWPAGWQGIGRHILVDFFGRNPAFYVYIYIYLYKYIYIYIGYIYSCTWRILGWIFFLRRFFRNPLRISCCYICWKSELVFLCECFNNPSFFFYRLQKDSTLSGIYLKNPLRCCKWSYQLPRYRLVRLLSTEFPENPLEPTSSDEMGPSRFS